MSVPLVLRPEVNLDIDFVTLPVASQPLSEPDFADEDPVTVFTLVSLLDGHGLVELEHVDNGESLDELVVGVDDATPEQFP